VTNVSLLAKLESLRHEFEAFDNKLQLHKLKQALGKAETKIDTLD
jgi:hypothetical protein